MQENENVQEQELDMNQLMKVRKEKLDKLKQEGKNPLQSLIEHIQVNKL